MSLDTQFTTLPSAVPLVSPISLRIPRGVEPLNNSQNTSNEKRATNEREQAEMKRGNKNSDKHPATMTNGHILHENERKTFLGVSTGLCRHVGG